MTAVGSTFLFSIVALFILRNVTSYDKVISTMGNKRRLQMKLHFYDDSIDGPACGAKSENSTDGDGVTCSKCQKVVAKMHADNVAYAAEEAERKRFLHKWAV